MPLGNLLSCSAVSRKTDTPQNTANYEHGFTICLQNAVESIPPKWYNIVTRKENNTNTKQKERKKNEIRTLH